MRNIMKAYEYIGHQIRMARKEKGWSLGKFRKGLLELKPPIRLGITTFSEMERGLIRANIDLLPQIANILEKPIWWFFPEHFHATDRTTLEPDIDRLIRRVEQISDDHMRRALVKSLIHQADVFIEALDLRKLLDIT
jgi:transcriptional regulator with XRE-family HTH domain